MPGTNSKKGSCHIPSWGLWWSKGAGE